MPVHSLLALGSPWPLAGRLLLFALPHLDADQYSSVSPWRDLSYWARSPAIAERLRLITVIFSAPNIPRRAGPSASSRLRAFRVHPADLRVKSNFLSRIKLFLPVQSHPKKIFCFYEIANH